MQMHNHAIPLKSALKEIFKILWINIGFPTISCAQFIRTTFGSTYTSATTTYIKIWTYTYTYVQCTYYMT